jgi:hypothetical protein
LSATSLGFPQQECSGNFNLLSRFISIPGHTCHFLPIDIAFAIITFPQNKKNKAKIADPFSENARPGRVFRLPNHS